jgi:hypothetical protein
MSPLEFAFACVTLLALILVACIALSIALGWVSDLLTGKEIDE